MSRVKDNGSRINKREYINIVRGCAIFLMLWGHAIQVCGGDDYDAFVNPVFRIIYIFHMPLFMAISGYLFFHSEQSRCGDELIKHKVLSTAHPIIMCGILHFFLVSVVSKIVFEKDFSIIFSGTWVQHLNAYWFLWSVLSSSLMLAIATQKCKTNIGKVLACAWGIVVVAMFPNSSHNIFLYPYYLLGYLFAKNDSFRTALKKYSIFSLVLFPVLSIFYSKECFIDVSGISGNRGILDHMLINFYRWISGAVGCVFAITVIDHFLNVRVGRWIASKMAKLGENSLQVYILSCIFLSVYLPLIIKIGIKLAGRNILLDNIFLFSGVYSLAVAIFYSWALLTIEKILYWAKIGGLLFGK